MHDSIKITNPDYPNRYKFSLILIFTHITAGHAYWSSHSEECHTLLPWTGHAYGWRSLVEKGNSELREASRRSRCGDLTMTSSDEWVRKALGRLSPQTSSFLRQFISFMTADSVFLFLHGDEQYSVLGMLSLMDSDKELMCWWAVTRRQTQWEKMEKTSDTLRCVLISSHLFVLWFWRQQKDKQDSMSKQKFFR